MKENYTFMAHQSTTESNDKIPSHPLDINNNNNNNMEQQHDVTQNTCASKTNLNKEEENIALQKVVEEESVVAEDSGRERLKRHRVEVAGSVWIPEKWGQEELLKDWVDCTNEFDAPLVHSRITIATEALVEDGRKVNASGLSIQNRC
ncbi:hypothetical protein Lal_00023489 [Lupinus albus]|uniref:Uncharacterized protein n=1 Tax=Lupinus albus TaxID=3870 RepID=A0A6A5NDE9_LUPAL|nr:hypothetical protein Lalb_Chr20g0111741 [Lupinus albus]KAF1881453.1 hypothetical protein Lal_00023489 [Lupinus albus]